jgi:hypothetical protein
VHVGGKRALSAESGNLNFVNVTPPELNLGNPLVLIGTEDNL